jgi:hypothetical protein
MKFTTEEKLKEIEREITHRRRIYPNRVATGRLGPAKALLQLHCMEAIADDYRQQLQRERLL